MNHHLLLVDSSSFLCRGELEELLKLVKPQHFLPVHGEYAFLCAHAQLARDCGIHRTSVIKNGEMLGISPPRNGKSVGSSQGLQKLGTVPLNLFYNDGNKVKRHSLAQIFLRLFVSGLFLACWKGGRELQEIPFCKGLVCQYSSRSS